MHTKEEEWAVKGCGEAEGTVGGGGAALCCMCENKKCGHNTLFLVQQQQLRTQCTFVHAGTLECVLFPTYFQKK